MAGDARRRWGLGRSHGGAFAGLAGALGLLAAAPGSLAVAVLSAALFGGAYMALTGLYLVASTEILPERPATGPVGPFLAVSSGQVVGSAGAGAAIDAWGPTPVFAATAVLALIVAGLSWPVAARAAGEARSKLTRTPDRAATTGPAAGSPPD